MVRARHRRPQLLVPCSLPLLIEPTYSIRQFAVPCMTPSGMLKQRPSGMQRLRRFIIQSKKRALWIGLALVTLLVVWSILLPLAQTGTAPDWTGFGPALSLPRYPHISVIGLAQPAKTLWDWLQLLAALLIPVVVAYAGLSFTRQQSQTERKIADDRLL